MTSVDEIMALIEQLPSKQQLDLQRKLDTLVDAPIEEDAPIIITPLRSDEIIAQGLLGGWADEGIEDSVQFVEELREKRRKNRR
jgi:hypothetical protein